MGKRAVSVGARMDGSVDVDIGPDEEDKDGQWSLSHVQLDEAEFLYEELGRVIARQKERGYPKPEPKAEPEPAKLPPPAD